ncbi:LacI family DNA-binding transcriptional regulator [Blastococcus sp. SYSU D00669]
MVAVGGDRARANIYDVAREAGVSSATVSRVLAGRDGVAERTRAHVLAVAERMDYRPNEVARSLSRRTSDMVAVMLPDITNPFFSELVKGVQSAAFRRGLTTLICNTEAEPALERKYLDGLLASQVRYILVVGLTLDADTVAEYVSAGLTFIALDRPLQRSSQVLIQSDNRAGGELAVRHLIELGHRRIAHIAGPADVPLSADRRQGYLDALRAADIEIDDALLVESEFSEHGGARAFEELDRRAVEFTAVFAGDDLIAMGALSSALERGRSVPDDLSLVGFDDVIYARFTAPSLTTVRQDALAMGERAVEILAMPEAERPTGTVVLPVSLVVRGSTGLPPNGSGAPRKDEAWSD